jgi:hypothetical protein
MARRVSQLWKPDVGEGVDVTDAEETGVGRCVAGCVLRLYWLTGSNVRLVLAAHFGLDLSQKDEAMKEWLVKTRSNRGKLTLRVRARCGIANCYSMKHNADALSVTTAAMQASLGGTSGRKWL